MPKKKVEETEAKGPTPPTPPPVGATREQLKEYRTRVRAYHDVLRTQKPSLKPVKEEVLTKSQLHAKVRSDFDKGLNYLQLSLKYSTYNLSVDNVIDIIEGDQSGKLSSVNNLKKNPRKELED